MNSKLMNLSDEFFEKAEELETKLSEIRGEIHEAEKTAHARGFQEGLTAQDVDFDGKIVIVKVPEDRVEETTRALQRLDRSFKNTRFVILSDYAEMKELHELELKALGLKRLE